MTQTLATPQLLRRKNIATRPVRRWRLMATVLSRRAAIAAPLLVVISAAIFAIAAASPFDPLAAYLGDAYPTATQSQRDAAHAAYVGDRSWIQAWWQWCQALLHGDLGWSSSQSQTVSHVLAERLPFTAGLSACALITSVIVAVILGSLAAMRPNSLLDRACVGLATVLASLPPFVLSLGLISLFAVGLRVFPTSGAGRPGDPYTVAGLVTHAMLPFVALTVSLIPWLLMTIHASVSDAVTSDSVRGARSRGINGLQLVRHHLLPISVLPTLALIGTRLSELIAGAAVIESVFGWPGLAGVFVESAVALDFPLLAALTVAAALLVLAGSALSDAVTVFIDPRVRRGP